MSKPPKNWIWKAITSKAGLIIYIATITTSITVWILHETHQAELLNINASHTSELATLREQLGSIHRRLGNSDFLDINKLFIHKADFRNIPAGTKYFGEANFYAITNTGNWQYSFTNYNDLMKLMTGDDATGGHRNVFENVPLHVWRKPKILSVRNSSLVSNLLTVVVVQKISIDAIKDALGFDIPYSISVTNESTNTVFLTSAGTGFMLPGITISNNVKTTYFVEANYTNKLSFKESLPGDVAGVLLADTLDKCFMATTMVEKELNGEIIELQKLNNVVYGQFRFTLKDVTIDGKHYDKYYYYFDGMAIGLNSYIYVVASFIPSEEPSSRGADFQWLSDWYRNFAILTDP